MGNWKYIIMVEDTYADTWSCDGFVFAYGYICCFYNILSWNPLFIVIIL